MSYIGNSFKKNTENAIGVIRKFMEGEITLDQLDDDLDELAKEAEYDLCVAEDIEHYYSEMTA